MGGKSYSRRPKIKGFNWISTRNRMPEPLQKVSVFFDIYASPLSMGMADKFIENECWRADGKWVHLYRAAVAELQSHYITHWLEAA